MSRRTRCLVRMTVGSGLAAGDSDGAAVEDGVGATTAGAIAAGNELRVGETEPEGVVNDGGISASRTPASLDDASDRSNSRWRCTPGWCLMPVNENTSMKRLTASAVMKDTMATAQLGKCRRWREADRKTREEGARQLNDPVKQMVRRCYDGV